MQASGTVYHRQSGPTKEAVGIKGDDGAIESAQCALIQAGGFSESKVVVQPKAAANDADGIGAGLEYFGPVHGTRVVARSPKHALESHRFNLLGHPVAG